MATSISLAELLKLAINNKATDVHITVGLPPMIRIDTKLMPLKFRNLSPHETKDICYSILTDSQKHSFEENLELDFSFGLEGIGRFRGNIFMQKGSVAGAFRVLQSTIRTSKELGLPPIVQSFCRKPRGLVLVTGPTGSGKTTTMASMVNSINEENQKHIISIEDPVEYVFEHKNCIISQREVGKDTKSFHNALRSVLREDPDVVLIGEMRDLETIRIALALAETGHLTIATLHTNTAVQTINRIIDVFPLHEQLQVRAQLSLVLEGVLCQCLVPKSDGGMALALEVLVPNSAVRNLIREGKIHQIYAQQQLGQDKYQMQTLNQSLANLYLRQEISYLDAVSCSQDVEEFKKLIGVEDESPNSKQKAT